MEFRLLGPLEVWCDGNRLELRGRQRTSVLATLLLNANRVVAVDRLVDVVWGPHPPATARSQAQANVSALRRLLGRRRTSIVTRDPGYLMVVGQGELDLLTFSRLVAEARAAASSGCSAAAARGFRTALALWHGAPLAGLAPGLSGAAAHLTELRLAVLEERIDADLATSRSEDLVAELSGLVADHPLRERLRAALMLALYRAGRQADALEVFRQGRQMYVRELGIEPGAELALLHGRILSGDVSLDAPRRTVASASYHRHSGVITERRLLVSVSTPASPFPDAEALAVAFLGGRTELSGVPVGVDLPPGSDGTRPALVVSRLGGSFVEYQRLDAAVLRIDAYGPDKAGAHELARRVRAVLALIPETSHGDAVVSEVIEDEGPRWLPDEAMPQARRYTVTVRLFVHPT